MVLSVAVATHLLTRSGITFVGINLMELAICHLRNAESTKMQIQCLSAVVQRVSEGVPELGAQPGG